MPSIFISLELTFGLCNAYKEEIGYSSASKIKGLHWVYCLNQWKLGALLAFVTTENFY